MFEVRSAIERSADRTATTGKPFIGPELPLVGPKLPVAKPNIGLLLPFVGIRGFRGFTAIELLITIAIAAILVSLALPSMRVFVQNNRLRTEASEFFAAINLARTEAKANAGVATLCVSTNQSTCVVAATGWDKGWLAKIWVDANGNGAVDAGEERILRARPAPDNGIVLSTAGGTKLSFSASGAASGALTFSVCDSTRSGEEGRSITILGESGSARLNCLPSTGGPPCTTSADTVTPACS